MSEIKPALTAEEWATPARNEVPVGKDGFVDGRYILDSEKHRIAAQCLHGQPFGFTRQDVALLGLIQDLVDGMPDLDMPELKSLTDRIEALLPPEDG